MQKLMKRVLKLFGLMLLSGGLLMVFCAWQVYDYAQNKKPLPKKADAVVVLGAAAWGNNPSPVLRERINYGIKLYQQHTVQKMIFTPLYYYMLNCRPIHPSTVLKAHLLMLGIRSF